MFDQCAIPTTVHVELPDSGFRACLETTPHTGELVIGSVTFATSPEIARRVVLGLTVDAIRAGLLDDTDLDSLYADWYAANAWPRVTKARASR
jgi:hypothetical protein